MRGSDGQEEWIFQFLKESCAGSILLIGSQAMSWLLDNFARTHMLVTSMHLPSYQPAKVAKHLMLTRMGTISQLYFPITGGSMPSSTNAGMLYQTHSTKRNIAEAGKRR